MRFHDLRHTAATLICAPASTPSPAAHPAARVGDDDDGRAGSDTEQVEEGARCHNRHARVLAGGKEAAIARGNMTRPSFESRGDVLARARSSRRGGSAR
ncbi:MAG: hypothetical protein ACXVH7_13325 [Thermoanaerobaculia bacterium]